jgi:hypothetical protein
MLFLDFIISIVIQKKKMDSIFLSLFNKKGHVLRNLTKLQNQLDVTEVKHRRLFSLGNMDFLKAPRNIFI